MIVNRVIGAIILASAAVLVLSSSAVAASSPVAAARPIPAVRLGDLRPLPYDCRLAMSVNDGSPLFERHFTVEADAGPHGGQSQTFDAGNGYKIEMIADAKWMVLTWTNGEQIIAKGMFVGAEGEFVHRAAILFRPSNETEQVALSCSRRPPH